MTRQKLLHGRLGQTLLPWKILNVLSIILRDINSLIRSEYEHNFEGHCGLTMLQGSNVRIEFQLRGTS